MKEYVMIIIIVMSFVMPAEYNRILKYNHGEKSLKAPAIIYSDFWPSGYSLFTNCSFNSAENKLDCYKSEDCIERFCEVLREHALKIINDEKYEMIPLTDEENKSYRQQKVCYISKKYLELIKWWKCI